jgi:hypothetical protein
MRARLLLPTLAVVAGLVAAAPAAADVLMFTYGPSDANLCQAAPDGSGRSQLTTDATGAGTDVYSSPSLSASGGRLVFLRRGQLYVTDGATGKTLGPAGAPGQFLLARLRSDGGKIAVGEFGNGAGNAICTYAPDLSGRSCIGSGGSLGWAGASGVLTSETVAATGYRYGVCLLVDDPSVPSGCSRFVLADPTADLYDAVASPDGTQIAVTRAAAGAVRGSIAIYGAASGALVRVLTAGPNDGNPAWSPDGRSLVFDRTGAGVYTVSATAASPGSERLVAAGAREPTWGGGTIAATKSGCTMPKLVGKRLAAARTALRKAHCGTPAVKGSTSSRAKVTKQSPAAGRTVAAGKRPALTTRR